MLRKQDQENSLDTKIMGGNQVVHCRMPNLGAAAYGAPWALAALLYSKAKRRGLKALHTLLRQSHVL